LYNWEGYIMLSWRIQIYDFFNHFSDRWQLLLGYVNDRDIRNDYAAQRLDSTDPVLAPLRAYRAYLMLTTSNIGLLLHISVHRSAVSAV